MAGLRKLKTLTETFWRDEFVVTEADLDSLAGMVLEAGKPVSLDALAAAIVRQHCATEQEAAAQQASRGRLYRPMDSFAEGDPVVFSEFDFDEGRVLALRSGQNPRYPAFQVMRVALGGVEREFAIGLDTPHPLNRPVEELALAGDAEMDPPHAAEAFGPLVARKLEARLQTVRDWVRLNGMWFLNELLPDVHVGHLNLAEAVIDEAKHPVSALEMLDRFDMGASSTRDAQLFALNHALSQDERFDNVSATEERVWFLRAMEPAALFNPPAMLEPAFVAGPADYVGLTMVDLVEQIGDELDLTEHGLAAMADLHFELSFPHLASGTMPASRRLLQMLAQRDRRHFPIVLADSRTGRRFDAWVVPARGYVCGLEAWYGPLGLTVGAQVAVVPAGEANTFTLQITPVRGGRSEWLRTAAMADGKLMLQMQRASVPVRCDPNMLFEVPDRAAIQELAARHAKAQTSLDDLIRLAVQELAKLSGQGLAHAKSIYSIVNMHRRTGAVPVFAALTRSACYDPVGDGLWAFDASLWGRVYQTPEEMFLRPLTNRSVLARDQVVQYLGR